MCPVHTGFTAKQQCLAAFEAATLWNTSHWLLPMCQHHAHPWSRGSGGFPGFLGSVAWVVHLRSYFHNSCGSLRRGASPCEQWLFIHQRHYKHARRTYLIFLLSFFNDKLGSVYPLSSRHKGAGVPQTVTSKK